MRVKRLSSIEIRLRRLKLLKRRMLMKKLEIIFLRCKMLRDRFRKSQVVGSVGGAWSLWCSRNHLCGQCMSRGDNYLQKQDYVLSSKTCFRIVLRDAKLPVNIHSRLVTLPLKAESALEVAATVVETVLRTAELLIVYRWGRMVLFVSIGLECYFREYQ